MAQPCIFESLNGNKSYGMVMKTVFSAKGNIWRKLKSHHKQLYHMLVNRKVQSYLLI